MLSRRDSTFFLETVFLWRPFLLWCLLSTQCNRKKHTGHKLAKHLQHCAAGIKGHQLLQVDALGFRLLRRVYLYHSPMVTGQRECLYIRKSTTISLVINWVLCGNSQSWTRPRWLGYICEQIWWVNTMSSEQNTQAVTTYSSTKDGHRIYTKDLTNVNFFAHDNDTNKQNFQCQTAAGKFSFCGLNATWSLNNLEFVIFNLQCALSHALPVRQLCDYTGQAIVCLCWAVYYERREGEIWSRGDSLRLSVSADFCGCWAFTCSFWSLRAARPHSVIFLQGPVEL